MLTHAAASTLMLQIFVCVVFLGLWFYHTHNVHTSHLFISSLCNLASGLRLFPQWPCRPSG